MLILTGNCGFRSWCGAKGKLQARAAGTVAEACEHVGRGFAASLKWQGKVETN